MSMSASVYFGPYGVVPAIATVVTKHECSACGKGMRSAGDKFCWACGGVIVEVKKPRSTVVPAEEDILGTYNEDLTLVEVHPGKSGVLLPNRVPEAERPIGYYWSEGDGDEGVFTPEDLGGIESAIAKFKRVYARDLSLAAEFLKIPEVEVRFGVVCWVSWPAPDGRELENSPNLGPWLGPGFQSLKRFGSLGQLLP